MQSKAEHNKKNMIMLPVLLCILSAAQILIIN